MPTPEGSERAGFRELFPGYFPPDRPARRDAYERGLVSLDANALLDLYRLTPRARDEFFNVLDKVHDRLFVTHQAAMEFHRHRIRVVDARLGAGRPEIAAIEKLLTGARDKIREFSNRYQIAEGQKDTILRMVDDFSVDLAAAISSAASYDLSRSDVVSAKDPVLRRIDSLLDGRVGLELPAAEMESALAEARHRRDKKIPPGFMDDKKDSDSKAAGDYIVWYQLLRATKNYDGPVLFICNEKKEDWVRIGESNEILGPRPELVLEMQREANSPLHMVSVAGILREAKDYLGAHVSAESIREAEALPFTEPVLTVAYSVLAQTQFDLLSNISKKKVHLAIRSSLGRWMDSNKAEPGTWDAIDFPKFQVEIRPNLFAIGYLALISPPNQWDFLIETFSSPDLPTQINGLAVATPDAPTED